MVICQGDDFLQYLGYKKQGSVKNYLHFDNKIININEQNKYGESLIFVAAYFSEFELVLHLLSIGADPNIQNYEGNTALHAAAYFDNLKLLQVLVESGGDLRIVNNDGLRPCQMIKNVKNSQKMKSFEENLFYNFKNQLSFKLNPIPIPQRKNSILNNFSILNRNCQQKTILPYFTYQSGFGNYYCINRSIKGLLSSIKIIVNSQCLTNDTKTKVPTVNCGLHKKLLSKIWNSTSVSVKVIDLLDGKENISDRRTSILTNQFINEVNILGSLRHPHLLLLMSVNLILDEVSHSVQYQLIFERCEEGTIYHYLHLRNQEFEFQNLIFIIKNIMDAIIYIHTQNIVHTSISSHCLYLVSNKIAKLGNFENAMEISNFNDKRLNLISKQWNFYNFHNNLDDTYKWLAPEVLNGNFVVNPSIDLYGFAVVIWECFTKVTPHQNKTFKSLIKRYNPPFQPDLINKIPCQVSSVLQQAFKMDPGQRPPLKDIQVAIRDIQKSINHEDVIRPTFSPVKVEPDNEISIDQIECEMKITRDIAVDATDSISSMMNSILKDPNSVNNLKNTDAKTKSKSFLSKLLTEDETTQTFKYRNLAALPNPGDSETSWRYPSPQTEIVIEGCGSLSNSTHRNSIVRGMKPASHQTSLSTSQTNICTLLGTTDLIKSSSRGSLQKNSSSHSLNKLGLLPTKASYSTKQYLPSYSQFHKSTLKKLRNPNSNIANLIEKYENSDMHPYSSSNCSPQKNGLTRSLSSCTSPISYFNKSTSSKSSSPKSSNILSPGSSSKISINKRTFFSPMKQNLESAQENYQSKSVIYRKSPREAAESKLFGDITNNFSKNLR